MNGKTIAVIGAGALVVYLLYKSGEANAAPSPEPTEPEPEPGTTPPRDSSRVGAPDLGRTVEKIISRVQPPDPGEAVVVPLPEIAFPRAPALGTSPGNPAPSLSVGPGFVGWALIEEGDNLSLLAGRVSGDRTAWRLIRDHAKNRWARDLCPAGSYVSKKYYNGERGINLYARYGHNPPEDCTAPGYEAQYYSYGTGQHVVLFVEM